jgi:hypothetical protein
MDDSEYLRKQAEDARLAVVRTMSDLLADTSHLADPKRWTRSHPWASLGAAVVGGFLLGNSIPTGKKTSKAEDSDVAQSEESAKDSAAPVGSSRRLTPAGPSRGSSLAATLLKEAFTLIRPVVTSFLAAQIARASVNPEHSADPEHNGLDTGATSTGGSAAKPNPQ